MYKTLFCFTFLYISLLVNAKEPPLTENELFSHPPKIIRTCCAFGSDMSIAGIPFFKKTDIISVDKLGGHSFMSSDTEGNGIIYTKRGGFIDIGHLRDCADLTAFIYCLIKYKQEKKDWDDFDLGIEGGAKNLKFINPNSIDSLNIFELSGKIAFDLSLWHEISTWYGASYIPLIPEKYSSFSPEDVYSNLLGVKLGILALKSDLEYNDAMTGILNQTLNNLEALSSDDETYNAMEKVKNVWWTNEKKLPSKNVLLKRYFGIGTSLTPWLVDGFESNQRPYLLQKPDEALSNIYELQINLNFKFPFKSLFQEEHRRTITQKDFNILIKHIVADIAVLNLENSYKTAKIEKRERQKK